MLKLVQTPVRQSPSPKITKDSTKYPSPAHSSAVPPEPTQQHSHRSQSTVADGVVVYSTVLTGAGSIYDELIDDLDAALTEWRTALTPLHACRLRDAD